MTCYLKEGVWGGWSVAGLNRKKRKEKNKTRPPIVSRPPRREFLTDRPPDWIHSIRKQRLSGREYVSMLFHIHSPSSHVCPGPCRQRLTRTQRRCLVGCRSIFFPFSLPHCLFLFFNRPANYTAFCLSVQKGSRRTLVGVWPDVFPAVLHCRMLWRALCPVVLVLARAPLTR